MRGDVVDLNPIFLVDSVDQGWAEVGNDTGGVSIKRDTEKATKEEKPLKLVEVNDVKGAIVNSVEAKMFNVGLVIDFLLLESIGEANEGIDKDLWSTLFAFCY